MQTARRNGSLGTALRSGGAAVLLLLASFAAASDSAASNPESIYPDQSVTRTRADLEGRVTAEDQPFAFVVDASTASQGVVSVGYDIGLGSGISAIRPIPVVLQNEGVANGFTLGYGATNWLEPTANVVINSNLSNNTTTVDAIVGLKFQLTNPDSPWRAAVQGGALREGESAAWGTWVRGIGSFGTGPLLVEANVYVEHVFSPGRDAADFMGTLGADYRVLPFLRVGAEWVGQDLEETFDAGAEGGSRMGVGPDVALDLDHGRYQIVLTGLFGLNSISPTAMVRAGLLGSF
jgi:hypothetical protein